MLRMIPQEWEVGVGEWMLTEKGCKGEEVRVGKPERKGRGIGQIGNGNSGWE